MAGVNKSLKAGSVVFKAGDNADGMYLVRKGELVVYLEQGGKEVVLAKIAEGGMVGEMALFDRMPRSASVKASVDAEITHITLDDFGKLMKQIPKWFVGLMSTLSGRLRTTNERLKSVEANIHNNQNPSSSTAQTTSSTPPFHNFLRMIHVMELLWHRDGTKEGKEWMVQRNVIEGELTNLFNESPAKVKSVVDLLCSESIIFAKQDSYKNHVLAMPNRASLKQFSSFLSGFIKSNPKMQVIPDPIMNMLRMIMKASSNAPYDQFTISLEELSEDAKGAGINPENWKNYLGALAGFGEAIKVTKTSSKSGLGLRVTKTEVTPLMKNLNIFNKLSEKQLDQ